MLHILLDTTLLRSDPTRKKLAFQSLTTLAQEKKVQVYIPYIVKHEFLSHEEELYQSKLQTIISNIQNLQKKPLPEGAIELLNNSIENFHKIKNDINPFLESGFQLWCEEIGAKILPVCASHTHGVIDSYFQGKLPFKKKKSREDFPDAFICQAILALSKKLAEEELYVVTGDNTLSTTFGNQSNIIPIKALEIFIEAEACQELIKQIEIGKNNKSNQSIDSRAIVKIILDKKPEITYLMESKLLEEFQGKVIKTNDIQDEVRKVKIDYLGNIEYLNFSQDEIISYGSNTFIVPFITKVETKLSRFINKADNLEHEEEDDNDYVYSVDEDYSLGIEGRISIIFYYDIPNKLHHFDKKIAKLMKETEIRIDSIDKVSILPHSISD